MKKIVFIFCLCMYAIAFSQEQKNDTILEKKSTDSVVMNKKPKVSVEENIEKINAPAKPKLTYLNPTKAGLYSAVLPGLGQVYNKKYWKVPIVWGAVGTGVGVALWNQNQYKKYRGYFVDKLNGTPNEFLEKNPQLDKTALGNAQDRSKRQRDYAIAITGLIYILNIMDAVVDAHLYEGRKDPDLAISPAVIYDDFNTAPPKTGLSLSYRF